MNLNKRAVIIKTIVCIILTLSISFFPEASNSQTSPKAEKEAKVQSSIRKPQDVRPLQKGKVEKVIMDYHSQLPNGQKQREQLIQIKTSTGQVVEAINSIPPNLSFQVILKKGDKIILSQEDGAIYIEGYDRTNVSWALLIAFLLLVLFIGGKKGALALISLLAMGGFMLYGLIPSLKMGISPLFAASLFCVLSTLITITAVSGFNYKALAAVGGTVGGVVFAGLIGSWAVFAARLSGLMEVEMESLHYQYPGLQVNQMIAAAVLIGSLGAAMDVAMSISSSMYEVHIAAPTKQFKELFQSGINVGRDVMGTMVNTLILAYAGSALPTLILFTQINPELLLNMELVVKEIILSIVGSIGLILTIPLTASLGAYLFSRSSRLLLNSQSLQGDAEKIAV
ncbi:MAG: YibE/F family protein [Candidatus Caenarcaniphilales bacterium]|nr:YibE/F family protein [Candidatus Caenarcaniphilales bacterium]